MKCFFKACHGAVVQAGPGRADLKIMMGRAGPSISNLTPSAYYVVQHIVSRNNINVVLPSNIIVVFLIG